MDINILIYNIKKSSGIRAELQYQHYYKSLFYADTKTKICITFTPKSGSEAVFQNYLDLLGLLDDAKKYNPFTHFYRDNIYNNYVNKVVDINELKKENYYFIKFIQNPYIRAVSSFLHIDFNLSFREFMKKLINSDYKNFTYSDIFHFSKQYIDGEENYINKYIKIDKNEFFEVILENNKKFIFNSNNYGSIHYKNKNKNINNNIFCGDNNKSDVINNIPSSYKYFYDDEIKNMIDIYYKDDIEKYGYTFFY